MEQLLVFGMICSLLRVSVSVHSADWRLISSNLWPATRNLTTDKFLQWFIDVCESNWKWRQTLRRKKKIRSGRHAKSTILIDKHWSSIWNVLHHKFIFIRLPNSICGLTEMLYRPSLRWLSIGFAVAANYLVRDVVLLLFYWIWIYVVSSSVSYAINDSMKCQHYATFGNRVEECKTISRQDWMQLNYFGVHGLSNDCRQFALLDFVRKLFYAANDWRFEVLKSLDLRFAIFYKKWPNYCLRTHDFWTLSCALNLHTFGSFCGWCTLKI